MLADIQNCVEVKTLSPAVRNYRDLCEVLPTTLEAMAYSLRGNLDRSFRVILLLYDDALSSLGHAQRSDLFRLIQELARPYWYEFTWKEKTIDIHGAARVVEHPGFEQFQIWIESGGRKATPTFFLSRFWVWGEDGTSGKTWGEVEYNARFQGSKGSSAKTRLAEILRPHKHTYRGIGVWEGYPHLARAEATRNGELHATPPFMAQDFFVGFISPYRDDKPLISWRDAINDVTGIYRQIHQYYVQDFLPHPTAGPRVALHIATDEETYMAPGGALHLFLTVTRAIREKGTQSHYYAYQPKTQDLSLWESHTFSARVEGGVRSKGKCLIWATTDSDAAVAPKPGFPYGAYYTLAWLYSGLLPGRLERLIDEGSLTRYMPLTKQQEMVNSLFGDFPMTAYNVNDEIEPVAPEKPLRLWSDPKSTGWLARMRRRLSSDLTQEGYERYKDTFLEQLVKCDEPPVLDRSVAVIERPDGKPDVNLMKFVQRDFGRRL
jgi:hypothetical protein